MQILGCHFYLNEFSLLYTKTARHCQAVFAEYFFLRSHRFRNLEPYDGALKRGLGPVDVDIRVFQRR